jgi:hypothetical protein
LALGERPARPSQFGSPACLHCSVGDRHARGSQAGPSGELTVVPRRLGAPACHPEPPDSDNRSGRKSCHRGNCVTRRPRARSHPGHARRPDWRRGALVENALAIALLRAGHAPLEGFARPGSLYYWPSADGREIDFLVTGPTTIAVESKYAVRRSGKDYESITKAFGRGIMVSRRDTELDRDVLTVPAGVLLAHLG